LNEKSHSWMVTRASTSEIMTAPPLCCNMTRRLRLSARAVQIHEHLCIISPWLYFLDLHWRSIQTCTELKWHPHLSHWQPELVEYKLLLRPFPMLEIQDELFRVILLSKYILLSLTHLSFIWKKAWVIQRNLRNCLYRQGTTIIILISNPNQEFRYMILANMSTRMILKS